METVHAENRSSETQGHQITQEGRGAVFVQQVFDEKLAQVHSVTSVGMESGETAISLLMPFGKASSPLFILRNST